MVIELRTAQGERVGRFQIVDLNPLPNVIEWGTRRFATPVVHAREDEQPTRPTRGLRKETPAVGIVSYTEVFAYSLPTNAKPLPED